VTSARYAVLDTAGQAIMKREYSTQHIHYDPVCGYLHKFRLDDSQDVVGSGDPADSKSAPAADLPLIVAGSIAVALLLIIGILTL
jgi:hypothetical protein